MTDNIAVSTPEIAARISNEEFQAIRQLVISLLRPQENIVCRHLWCAAINALSNTATINATSGISGTGSRICPYPVSDITGKCYGVMAEHGRASCL